MGNSVGHVAWGTSDAHGAKILQILNPEPYACVWSDPWCRWISSTCFIFKADQPNRFKKKAGSLYPIVAIDVNEGFYVYPDTSRFDFYLEQANGIPPFFQPFNLEALQSEILKTSK